MKIEKVSLSRTIPTGPYMNDKIGMEATLEPGENESDALHALSGRIEKWHKENAPHLYQDSTSLPFVHTNHAHKDIFLSEVTTYHSVTLPIISKDKEKIEIAIDNAESVEELKIIKKAYELMPASCLTQYNKRMAELSSGKPTNFTEGLE